MGHSSLLGSEHAALEPAGRDTDALGPGDNSDSGSDRVGLEDEGTDDPVERHPAEPGVRFRSAKDIGVDRIFTPGRNRDEADASEKGYDDEDPDLAFIDSATSGDPADDEEIEDYGPGQESGRVARAQTNQHRTPVPGQNPAPDRPENPGLPGEDDDDDPPGDSEQDPDEHRPGRATGSRSARRRTIEGS